MIKQSIFIFLLSLSLYQVSFAQNEIKVLADKVEMLKSRGKINAEETKYLKAILSQIESDQASLQNSLMETRIQNDEAQELVFTLKAENQELSGRNEELESQLLNQSKELNVNIDRAEKYKDLFDKAESYNLSEESLYDSTVTITEWRSCTINEPRKLASLNSGSDFFYHTITLKNSGNIQLLGLGNVSLSKKQSILVADYIHYKDTICTPGSGLKEMKTIRMAAGVRLSLLITSKEKKLDATLPKKIAAAMELNMVEVTYRISTLGFANDTTQNIIAEAGQGNFDIDAYVKVMETMGKLIKTMKSDLVVNPIRLPHPSDARL